MQEKGTTTLLALGALGSLTTEEMNKISAGQAWPKAHRLLLATANNVLKRGHGASFST